MIKNLLPIVRLRGGSPLRRVDEHPFFALQREMNQMFDDIFEGISPAALREKGLATFYPSIDVKETDTEITVKAELPGMEEKDVEVTLEDETLTLRGEKKAEEKEEDGKGYWRRETSYGSFLRVIPLPRGIDQEKVDARFKNGVLSITLPKQEEEKVKGKKIAVKAE